MAEYSFQSQVCDLLNNLSTNGKYVRCTLKEAQTVEYVFIKFQNQNDFEHLVKAENSHQRAHSLILADRQNKRNCRINLPVLSYKEEKIVYA